MNDEKTLKLSNGLIKLGSFLKGVGVALILIGLISGVTTSTVNADSRTINLEWDAWVSEANPTDPGQSLRLDAWVGTTGSAEQRTQYFIEFNLTRIPTGVTISSATLDMNENGGTFTASPRTYRIFQMSENITEGGFDDDSTGPYVTWNNRPNTCQVGSNSQDYSGITTGTDDSFDITEFIRRVYNNSDYLRDQCGINHNYSGLVLQDDNYAVGSNNYKAYFTRYQNGPNSTAPVITVTFSVGGNITNSTLTPQDSNPTYFSTPTSHDYCVTVGGDFSFTELFAWYSDNGTSKDELKLSTSASVGKTKCFTDNTELNYDHDFIVIFNGTNSLGLSFEQSVHYFFIGEGNFWTVLIDVVDAETGSAIESAVVRSSHGSFSLIQDPITFGSIGYYTMNDAWVGYTNDLGMLNLYFLPVSSSYNIETFHPSYVAKFTNINIDGSKTINISLTPKETGGLLYNHSDPNYTKEVPTDAEFRNDIKDMIKQFGIYVLVALMIFAFVGGR